MAVRLNLGCGQKIWPGFINVDLPDNWSGSKPEVEADLRSLPFPDDYADEAHAIHVIEHFYLWDVPDVLKEWRRVLKPGGRLVLELPCMDKVLQHFAQDPIDLRMTWLALYGDCDRKDPNMVHKFCYSQAQMKSALKQTGFKDVRVMEPLFHYPVRDMRLEGTK